MKYDDLIRLIDRASVSEEFLGAHRSQILAEVHPMDLAIVVASAPGAAMWKWREEQSFGGVFVTANEHVSRGEARFSWSPGKAP